MAKHVSDLFFYHCILFNPRHLDDPYNFTIINFLKTKVIQIVVSEVIFIFAKTILNILENYDMPFDSPHMLEQLLGVVVFITEVFLVESEFFDLLIDFIDLSIVLFNYSFVLLNKL